MWTDSGVNLPPAEQLDEFRRQLDAAQAAGVTRFVLIGSDVAESRRALEFAEHDPRCVVAVGVHPHHAATVESNYIAQLRELVQHPAARALGECGLDYNRNYSPPDIQRKVFAEQVALAIEVQLPLYLHERDALSDQLAILSPVRHQLRAALTHCFTSDVAALQAYQDLDCYIGVTGWVCDERRGQALVEAVPQIHSERLVLETDSPYLLPRNIKPKPKSRQNKPEYVTYVAERVAQLRGESTSQLSANTEHNVSRLFGPWPS